VAEPSIDLVDLADLKMLPAWVKEPSPAERYAQHEGEDEQRETRREKPFRRGKKPFPKDRRTAKPVERDRRRRPQDRHRQHRRDNRPRPVEKPPPPVTIKFLPHPPALESVIAQIKSDSVAYSLYALARLFLDKPTRYDVRLAVPAESPLWQLGENGPVSSDRELLEQNAFRLAQSDFYKIEITETEQIKGNFTNVARDKLSRTLLGPTNHHDYQRRLRNLYEQRFSRRMSFAEYQRQIEIVSDPELVEQWKADARKVTTFTTLREETPIAFSSANEAERHFRQYYLPNLVRTISESTIGGVASRSLPDRALHRAIEDAWTRETKSPSPMMQELAAQFRQNGLQVFRQRRGMLFVSPIRPRPFAQTDAAVSPLVKMILEKLSANPGTGRKELADQLIVDLTAEEAEARKLALASDLRWLINEGYVIEFNDGSLDLPRAKAKRDEQSSGTTESKHENSADKLPDATDETGNVAAATVSTAEAGEEKRADAGVTKEEPTEIGGS
jgi:hypothetical protein